MIWLVFSNPDALNNSFLLPEGEEGVQLSKEATDRQSRVRVDIPAVRRTYSALLDLEVPSIANAFENAMNVYCSTLKQQQSFCQKEPLNHMVVLLENPQLHCPEFMSSSGVLLQMVASLPILQKEMLIKYYATYPVKQLKKFVSNLNQLITLRLLLSDDSPEPQKLYMPQNDHLIKSSAVVMMIFYYANLLLSSEMGKTRPMQKLTSSIAANPKPHYLQAVELEFHQLLMRLKVNIVCFVCFLFLLFFTSGAFLKMTPLGPRKNVREASSFQRMKYTCTVFISLGPCVRWRGVLFDLDEGFHLFFVYIPVFPKRFK